MEWNGGKEKPDDRVAAMVTPTQGKRWDQARRSQVSYRRASSSNRLGGERWYLQRKHEERPLRPLAAED